MKTLTWQKPGQQNVAQELIKIIINYVAELRVFKKADEDAKMKELVFENGYVVEYEEALNVANAYPMTVKFAISAQTVKMDEATFTQDWPENN